MTVAFVAGGAEALQVADEAPPNHPLAIAMSESWKFRSRSYPHFDYPVSSREITLSYVSNPQWVANRSFLPFLLENITIRKLSKYKKRKKEEKEKGSSEIKVTKERPIRRASHIDTQIFSYYRFLMMSDYDALITSSDIGQNVIAYRKIPLLPKGSSRNKCNIDFAKDVFDFVVKMGNCCVMTFDIKDFFESLDHEFLRKKWCKLLDKEELPKDHRHVFKNITNYSVVDWKECLKKLGHIRKIKGKEIPLSKFFFRRKKKNLCSKEEYKSLIVGGGLIKKNLKMGVPQGSPISDLLANLYMLDFDIKMRELEKKYGGYYRRYSDDILWICDSKHSQEIENEIISNIATQCAGTLTINGSKTTKTFFVKDENKLKYEGDKLAYLGFSFDGKKVLLKDQTVSRWKMNTSEVIKSHVKNAVRKSQKNGKSIKENIDMAQLHSKANIASDDYEDEFGRRKTNFMTYFFRAKKIFNQSNSYSMPDSQVERHKLFIKEQLERQIKIAAQA